MQTPEISPEMMDVVELLIPAGCELRNFIDGWYYIQHGPPLPTAWNMLESIEADRCAKTKSGELLLGIRKLAHRAFEGDPNAGGILLLIASEAALLFNMLDRKPDPLVLWLVQHCKLWPSIRSSLPPLEIARQDLEELRFANPQFAKTRFSTESQPTYMAAGTLAYMVLVRIGMRQPSNQKWAEKVRKLPDLDGHTVYAWWNLAKQQINDQYPDIAEVVLGHVLVGAGIKKTNGEAIRRIRYPFVKSVWQLFSHTDKRSSTSHHKVKTN